MTWSFDQVADALRASWSAGTCDPVDVHLWHPGNPARGQCGASAFVVQDLVGGDLVMAEVLFADGGHQGVHYWNRLPDGREIDLTREQFTDGERIVEPRDVARIPGPPMRRCVDQYLTLLQAVLAKLPAAVVAVDPAQPADDPA